MLSHKAKNFGVASRIKKSNNMVKLRWRKLDTANKKIFTRNKGLRLFSSKTVRQIIRIPMYTISTN